MQAHILGGEVKGKVALMFDDMISTAGSITGAAKTLHEHGVKEIHVAATHPVLCGPAIERLKAANLASLVVHRFDPAPRRSNPAANRGAHRRAALGRGDQADPPQRIGQPAVSVESLSARIRPGGTGGLSGRRCRICCEPRLRHHLGLKTGPANGTMSGFPCVGRRLIGGRLPTDANPAAYAMANLLKVEPRTKFGKRNNNRLHRAGKLPAVLYGHGEEAVSLTLGADQFEASSATARRSSISKARPAARRCCRTCNGTRFSTTCCTSICCA